MGASDKKNVDPTKIRVKNPIFQYRSTPKKAAKKSAKKAAKKSAKKAAKKAKKR